jgi:hypothetical protein
MGGNRLEFNLRDQLKFNVRRFLSNMWGRNLRFGRDHIRWIAS